MDCDSFKSVRRGVTCIEEVFGDYSVPYDGEYFLCMIKIVFIQLISISVVHAFSTIYVKAPTEFLNWFNQITIA